MCFPVGEVAFVEIFDAPKGTGIIEFNSADLARKAIEKMHRFEVRGRKLVVKEDSGDEPRRARSPRRNNNPNPNNNIANNGNNNNSNNFNNDDRGRWSNNDRSGSPTDWGFTYGLSPAFLESLEVKGPLVNRVFIANVSYFFFLTNMY
jgi:RNA recognition motif-containing protein